MTPMIDVVFQLLIFFVCTVNFQKQEESLAATPRFSTQAGGGGAAVDRPPPELEDLTHVELDITRTAGATQWTVNGDACRSLAEVRARLAKLAEVAPQTKSIVPVVLDAADDVPMADAIDAYDLCLKLGFRKVQFVTPE